MNGAKIEYNQLARIRVKYLVMAYSSLSIIQAL